MPRVLEHVRRCKLKPVEKTRGPCRACTSQALRENRSARYVSVMHILVAAAVYIGVHRESGWSPRMGDAPLVTTLDSGNGCWLQKF